MNIKLDQKKIYLIEGGLIFVMVVIFLFADVSPRWKEIVQSHRHRKEMQKKINAFAKLSDSKKERVLERKVEYMKKFYDLLSQKVEAVQDKVITGKNVPLVVMAIEDLSAKSRIKLEAIKPLDAIEVQGYELLPIEIKFKCHYLKLIEFLSDIQRSDLIATVKNVTIKKEVAAYMRLDVQLTFCVLFSMDENDIELKSEVSNEDE